MGMFHHLATLLHGMFVIRRKSKFQLVINLYIFMQRVLHNWPDYCQKTVHFLKAGECNCHSSSRRLAEYDCSKFYPTYWYIWNIKLNSVLPRSLECLNSPFRDIWRIISSLLWYLEDHQLPCPCRTIRTDQHPAYWHNIWNIKSVLPRSLICLNSPCQDIRKIISSLLRYHYLGDHQLPNEISRRSPAPASNKISGRSTVLYRNIRKINSSLLRYSESHHPVYWVIWNINSVLPKSMEDHQPPSDLKLIHRLY